LLKYKVNKNITEEAGEQMDNKNTGVALVTGASTGIGKATAQFLAKAGYQVFGTSRRIVADPAPGVTMLVCDVTRDESVRQTVKEVVARAGRIDVLVNNAGQSLIGAAEESSINQAQALFEVNVFGVIRFTTEVLPVMRKQRVGRIINVSSVAGFLPGAYTALYNATKHAVEGYSESLDHEVRTLGIRVLLVEPAFTRTALEENGMQPDRISPAYEAGRMAMNARWQDGIANGDPVEAVADAVIKAATDNESCLKLRYNPGKTSGRLRMMRRFVPEKAFEKSFRKQMGLPT
jgi:short-subunit dehydrogenase